jgi:hypothetical protein
MVGGERNAAAQGRGQSQAEHHACVLYFPHTESLPTLVDIG